MFARGNTHTEHHWGFTLQFQLDHGTGRVPPLKPSTARRCITLESSELKWPNMHQDSIWTYFHGDLVSASRHLLTAHIRWFFAADVKHTAPPLREAARDSLHATLAHHSVRILRCNWEDILCVAPFSIGRY